MTGFLRNLLSWQNGWRLCAYKSLWPIPPMSMPSFLSAIGVMDAFVSEVMWCHCLLPIFQDACSSVHQPCEYAAGNVISRQSLCGSDTPQPGNNFKKQNYLFHSAHNCTLFEFCLVSLVMLCFQKLAQGVQDCAVWHSVVYIHCEQIVLGYSFHFDCTKGLHVKLLNGKKYCGRHVQIFTSSLDKRLSAWVCVYNFAADYFLQPRLDHIGVRSCEVLQSSEAGLLCRWRWGGPDKTSGRQSHSPEPFARGFVTIRSIYMR